MEYRVEHDSMGEVRVPADKYWGAQTERSHNNFPIGVGIETMPAEIGHAFGILLKAAARANRALRPEKMTEEKLAAIEQAADEVISGQLLDNFPLVVWQTGSGTILDTSRLQSTLAKRFCISPKNVHAHVYGEHGDSSFVPWSLVHIANNHIDSYKEHSPDCDRIKWNQDYEEIEQFVKTSGAQVIKNKGATFYAVAMSVCHLCKCVQSTAGTAVTVSTMMHGEYGVSDVCLSTLALVDNQGVRGKILNQLTDGEIDKLRASAEKLKEVIRQVEI